MPLKLFNLDLHISVIKDLENIINTLFGKKSVEITNWSISSHNWVFNQPTSDVKIINQHTYHNINDTMIKEFNVEYSNILSNYDGFIVTHTPVFALIYEQYDKPIIIINSCRFDQPFCWENNITGFKWLVKGLHRLKEKGLLHIISNNKADQDYLFLGSGLESEYIPSLCDYTQAPYNPNKSQAILYNSSPYINTSNDNKKSNIAPKLNLGYSWKELHSYKAIIHLPYEISTMSIFEQYTAGVPMLFPTKQFYKECHNKGIIVNKSIYGSLVNTDIDFWLDRADFYNNDIYKNIIYFNSFEEINEIINNFSPPSQKEINKICWEHKHNILEKWNNILCNIFLLKNKSISWKYTTDYIQSDKIYNRYCKDKRIRYIKSDALINSNIDWYSQQQFELDKRLVLITSHSDLSIDKNLFETNCHRSNYWITTNKLHKMNSEFQRLFGLPLGLTNSMSGSFLHELYSNTDQIEIIRNEIGANDNNEVEKKILCYMNFSINTNLTIREKIWQYFYEKNFIIHEYPKNTHDARENYLRKMALSKFVICPPGNGIDTHRIWEALYVGCIPIVLDNPVHDGWQDLPILFIKCWEDITEDFLNRMWIEMSWRQYNFDKLTNTYWINFIEKLCDEAYKLEECEQIFWIKTNDILSGHIDPKNILNKLNRDKSLIFNITGYVNNSSIKFQVAKFLAYFEEWEPNTNLFEDT